MEEVTNRFVMMTTFCPHSKVEYYFHIAQGN
jgi:hypothetical protein